MHRSRVVPRTRRPLPAAVLLSGVALVLTACGGSSDSTSAPSSSDASSSSAAGSGPTGDPIKIGFAVSLSGPLASSSTGSAAAARAWQEQTNADGGIGGRPVEVVIEDSKNNAAAAQAAVKKLVDQKVVAVMLTDAVAEGAVGAFLQAQNVPVIGSGGYDQSVWNKLPNFFTQSANSLVVINSLVTSAKSSQAQNFVAAVCAETATCAEGATAVFTPGTKAAGINYGGFVKVSATAANYTAECLSFNKKKADYIALLVSVDSAVRVMTDCVQQGYKGKFATSSTSFDPEKYGKIKGMEMTGTLNGFPWWIDAPPVVKYRTAMETYEPKASLATSAGTTVWASLELFRKAVGTSATTVTPESVFSAYHAVKDETLEGLLPQPVTFTKGMPSPDINCFWLYEFKGGDKEPALVAPSGTSGNGVSGDLATACTPKA